MIMAIEISTMTGCTVTGGNCNRPAVSSRRGYQTTVGGVMAGSTGIMNLKAYHIKGHSGCGTSSSGMTICTWCYTCNPEGMIGIDMLVKIDIMTTITVTNGDIGNTTRSNNSQQTAVGGVMTASTGIMDLIVSQTDRCGGESTRSGGMTGITVGGICYVNCMIGIDMLVKIGIMTTVTITDGDIGGTAGAHSKQGTMVAS